MSLKKEQFQYKWVILSICFLLIFISLGFCSGPKSLYLSAVTKALGIKRSVYALTDSCRFIATAITNFFFGALVLKFGSKKIVTCGVILLITSSLVYSYATTPITLYTAGALLGAGFTFTSTAMVSSIIRRWFSSDLGKYTGICLSANGIGGACAVQILSPVINNPDNPYGYRDSYLITTVILVVLGILIIILLKDKKDIPLMTSAVSTKKRGIVWAGLSIQEAKRKPYFYITGITIFVTGTILQGLAGIYAAYMKDQGLNDTTVAAILTIYTAILTISKIAIGFAYDRFGLRKVVFFCQLMALICLITAPFISPCTTGIILAGFCGIAISFSLPLETIMVPLMTNDLFGYSSFDTILGIFLSMNYAGYALGAPIANLFYDMTGSYKPMMITFAIVVLGILITFQLILNYAEKLRKSTVEA